jgi:Na+/melibiose symporter-like transporter
MPFRKPARLRLGCLVPYALPSLVASVAALPMALFVPAFYADELGLPVLVAVAVLKVPEGRPEGFAHEHRSFFASLRLVARNPAFGRMIGCVLLFVSGIAIQGTLHRLVLTDVMGDESRFALMILIENLATLAAVPLWMWLSLRIVGLRPGGSRKADAGHKDGLSGQGVSLLGRE